MVPLSRSRLVFSLLLTILAVEIAIARFGISGSRVSDHTAKDRPMTFDSEYQVKYNLPFSIEADEVSVTSLVLPMYALSISS